MRMDLIQPFIGSLDAVLAEMMKTAPRIVDLNMEEEGYRRKGLAASVIFKGEIQGRVILDMDPQAATQVASYLAGEEVDSAQPMVREAVCELANMVIGKRRHSAQRSRLSIQSVSSRSAHRGTVRRSWPGLRSHNPLLRDAIRQRVSRHLHAISPAPLSRTLNGGSLTI